MRKRTQQVRGYRDGGAVLDSPLPTDADPAAATSTPPPEAAAPDTISAEDRAEQLRSEEAVLQALAKQRLAEELSRLPPAERQLREMGMSQAEAWFTLAHPEAIAPENLPVVSKAYRDGQRIGLARDSHQLFSMVLLALDEQRQAQEGGARLDREAERHHLIAAANETAEIPTTSSIPERSPPAIRRSMPMAAPPTRNEVQTMSGRPRNADNTLTPEERQIAHTLPAPHMSDREKEWSYLQQKKKYRAMVASGEYDPQRGR